MYHRRNRFIVRFFVLLVAAMGLMPVSVARASDEPELPAQCGSIVVPAGNKLSFHVYASGVQIYMWNGTTNAWDFVAPRADLFAEKNFFGEVGSHFGGPKWKSKSGSQVEARRVQGTGCQPDPTAIEWLLLVKFGENIGPGIFEPVTYIQRTNTTGGLRPTVPGTPGEVREVPYTAEYYFYRAQD